MFVSTQSIPVYESNALTLTITHFYERNYAPNNPDYDIFYPGMGVDGTGKMFLVFGGSSAVSAPSIWVAKENSLDSAIPLKSVSSVNDCDSKGRCRYGDYFAVSSNPNGGPFWISWPIWPNAVRTILIGRVSYRHFLRILKGLNFQVTGITNKSQPHGFPKHLTG